VRDQNAKWVFSYFPRYEAQLNKDWVVLSSEKNRRSGCSFGRRHSIGLFAKADPRAQMLAQRKQKSGWILSPEVASAYFLKHRLSME
jgi:hypothetical protein